MATPISNPTSTYLDDAREEGFEAYRTVSKLAVLSLFFGLISAIGIFFPALLLIPLIGLVFGIVSWRAIRRYPDELSGKIPAVLGTLLCGAIFFGGVATHSVIYATEVPDGYARVNFESLKSKGRGEVPPDVALQLDGQPIFIKGYIYPGGQRYNLRQFVLVPDLGTCCFGGQPKLTHMIEVTLNGGKQVDYSMRKRKLAGTIRVAPDLKPVSGLGGVYYQLTADYVK